MINLDLYFEEYPRQGKVRTHLNIDYTEHVCISDILKEIYLIKK